VRVIVTGGAGFIGSAVCRHFAGDLGWQVLMIDSLTYAGNLSSVASVFDTPNFKFVKTDICDQQTVRDCFTEFEPDAIVHLAAESHVDRSITHSREFVRTNIMGTCVLLEEAREFLDRMGGARRDAFRFVHVSTDEVYGSLGPDGAFCETTPFAPRSPYSASKASSDHLVHAWGHTYGLPVIVSHCSNNYGPNQLPEKLIPLTILNGLERRNLPVYGDGLNIRDWLHVDDHVLALELMLTKGAPGEAYNVGGRNERTNLHVVHVICDLLDKYAHDGAGHRDLITFVKDRPGHDRRYAIDAAKIEGEIGWRARDNFETGIEKTVRWYLDNKSWWEPLRAAGHGKARLGLMTESATAG
jgi:dTDP-glucose 4,6-dehydratase